MTLTILNWEGSGMELSSYGPLICTLRGGTLGGVYNVKLKPDETLREPRVKPRILRFWNPDESTTWGIPSKFGWL